MHLQQLKGMPCFELDIWKRCNWSILGLQKDKGFGPRDGACLRADVSYSCNKGNRRRLHAGKAEPVRVKLC